MTLVIVRDDLIGKAPSWTPEVLKYDIQAAEGSMYNTPPCYAIYVAGLVQEWIKKQGGIKAVEAANKEKAALFYDYLDNSKMFRAPVEKDSRSLMNIPFVIGDEAKEKQFIAEAAKEGMVNLAGHRLVGGMRASIYNAMPKEGVVALIDFMKKFEINN
jgi:phosphoserine aminotransferase